MVNIVVGILHIFVLIGTQFVGEEEVFVTAESAPGPGDKSDNKPWDERDVRRVTVTLTGVIQVSPKLGSKQRTLSSTIKVRNLGMDII